MKFSNLKPRFSECVENWTAETGGTLTGRFQIIFSCPACPRPHDISFYVGSAFSEAPKTWAASPYPPSGADWIDRLTVTPSVDNTHNIVKRGLPDKCRFHGTITNGEVHQ